MGIFSKLFGGRRGRSTEPSRNVAELLAPLSTPAVQLHQSSEEPPSFFGGDPKLDPGTQWPSNDGKPLTFLASIDLNSLHRELEVDWLPLSGRLLFFYDVDEQPWGFEEEDRNGWAVIHVANEPSNIGPAAGAPNLPHHFMSFRRIETFPSYELLSISVAWSMATSRSIKSVVSRARSKMTKWNLSAS